VNPRSTAEIRHTRGVRDLVLELVVALFVGERAWDMNLDLAYGLGALVVSVPAIVILERRRRRRL
jgi:hypothetical protein